MYIGQRSQGMLLYKWTVCKFVDIHNIRHEYDVIQYYDVIYDYDVIYGMTDIIHDSPRKLLIVTS